jgi:hypothetical protein
MSYLEEKIKQKDRTYSAPAKEGGLKAIEGVKIWGHMGYQFYSIPLFHHSFRLLTNNLNQRTNEVIDNIMLRCQNECKVNLKYMRGKHGAAIDHEAKECKKMCDQWYVSGYNQLQVS